MANRIIEEMNRVLNNASAIEAFYTRRYLENGAYMRNQNLAHRTTEHAINMYFRVGGFDFYEDQEHNFAKVSNLVGQITSSLAAMRQPFSYTIHGQDTNIEVFYGANYECAPVIRNALNNNLHNAIVDNIWIHQDELISLQKFNSIIVGPQKLAEGTIDRVINALSGSNYIINFLCIPCSSQELVLELGQMNDILANLQRVSNFEWTYGNGRQRKSTSDNHDVLDTIKVLENEKGRINSALIAGAWKVLIHVGAFTQHDLELTTAQVIAAFKSSTLISETDSSATIPIPWPFPVISRSIWEYPSAFLGTFDLGGLYSNSTMNLVNTDCLRSIVAPPTQTHGTYNIRHMGNSAVSSGAFSSQAPQTKGNRIATLGSLSTGTPYNFSIDDLKAHAFITGASGFGKSTTVKRILHEATKNGVPFIVVEAAKKEYWELKQVSGLEGICVYSAGMDALPLQINPFQPEANTQLEYHIQSLISALLSMFDQSDPLPQILTELVYKCYEEKGWDTQTRVRAGIDLEYPNFDDMLAHLDEVIEEIGYDDEIKNRMRGVVKIRIQSLIRQAGRSLNTKNNLSVEELFATSAIIELDDFADQLKPFVASVVALKVNEYTRQCRIVNSLKRLLVLEEAHHVLPNPQLRNISPNASKCAAFFSSMLAEVQAYGTGIIIADQRPSAIAPAAIANTSTKIVHNIHEGDDIDRVIGSLNLQNHARAHLNILGIGEAVVVFPQTDRICIVRVDGKKNKSQSAHLGCLFCTRVCMGARKFSISQYEINLLSGNGISQSSLQKCITSVGDRIGYSLSTEDAMCLAGQLCQLTCAEDDNPVVIRQHLFDLYAAMKK